MVPFMLQLTAGTPYATIAALYDTLLGNTAGTTKKLSFKGNLVADSGNASNITVKSVVPGTDFTLTPGEYFPVESADIGSMSIKGNGMVLKLVGVIDRSGGI